MEKCPKCDETECDCVVNEEDNGPMLIMRATADIKRDRTLYEAPVIAIQRPSETPSQYDNVANQTTRN